MNIEKLDIQAHKYFIIERSLEKGRFDLIAWLFTAYKVSDIVEVLLNSRNISKTTKLLWSKVLV